MSRNNIKTPECVSFVNQILNLYYANGELNLPPYLRGKGIENINFEALKKLKGEFEDKLEFEGLVCIESYYTKVGFLRVEDGSFRVKFVDAFGKIVRGSKE